MYKRVIREFPRVRHVMEYHTARFGAPGQKRAPKQRLTPEQMMIKNQRNKERKCLWRLWNNFAENDYFVTFTYAKEARPPDMAAAQKHWKDATGIMRKEFRKRGHELKWIRNIEVGTRGAWHMHAVINRIPDADLIIKRAWPHGRVHYQLMYEKGSFRELAAYLTKSPRTDPRLRESNYSTSRNLPIPEPKEKVMSGRTFGKAEKLRVPKGYYLEKESYYEGTNPKTGYRYREYALIRIQKPKNRRNNP